MLRGGLGWGNLPAHLAHPDIKRRALVRIRPEAWAEDEHTIHLAAVYRRDSTLGPAHRWVIERLATLCAAEVRGSAAR
jgi:DNA-binding transcriptional LysR family regulator